MKFVIVDDEEVSLAITRKLLQHILGEMDISTFNNSREALLYFKNDLDPISGQVTLLLDLNMPAVSGWDFLEYFNGLDEAIKSRVYVYLLTSSIDPVDKRKALLNSNIIAYLTKPLTAASIIEHFGGTGK